MINEQNYKQTLTFLTVLRLFIYTWNCRNSFLRTDSRRNFCRKSGIGGSLCKPLQLLDVKTTLLCSRRSNVCRLSTATSFFAPRMTFHRPGDFFRSVISCIHLQVVFVRISLWTVLASKAFGESISFLSLPPITHFSKLSQEKNYSTIA